MTNKKTTFETHANALTQEGFNHEVHKEHEERKDKKHYRNAFNLHSRFFVIFVYFVVQIFLSLGFRAIV
jgi:hypothetical protein